MSQRVLFGWLIVPDMSWAKRSVTLKTLIVCAVAIVLFGFLFLAVGGVDVAANQPDSWLARNFLHFTFKRSIATRSDTVQAPNDLGLEGRVRIGARQYDMVCANCHGAPGIGQSAVALSMSPRPQHLPRVVEQFTDEELFLIVQNGVRFSAMPSWPNSTRNDEVWSMVAFLKQLPKMDAKTYLAMTAPAQQPEQTPAIPLGDIIALRPSDTDRSAPPVDEFLYAAPAIGFSDRTLRVHPIAACAGCHGKEGDGLATNGEAPNLTLHDAAYLKAALDSYSKGERKSGFMQEVASQLSSQQIIDLANYYEKLPVRDTNQASSLDPALIKRGEAIARGGIKESATVACANCHESAGTKLSGAPRIAGQSEVYLRRQLTAMRRGGRGNTAGLWNPMAAEAHDLEDRDIAGLSAYYASLKPSKGGAPMTASIAWPAGDAAKGKPIFEAVCTKCHFNGGRGDDIGRTPDITLHAAPYVAQQLYSFRARIRQNNQMLETVQALSYDDIGNLAAYVNGLKPEKAIAPVDAAAAARGAALAEKGNSERAVPACLGCHGAEGVAALPLAPRLQGQSAPYLRERLAEFAGEGNTLTINPMPAIAQKLTQTERADLAAYFAAATPLDKPAAP